jgi:glycerophosphoryl diester phosphodiesterase
MQVVGHRGAAGEAPENTIAGFRHAIDRGVRYLEFDLRLSSDKEIVITHDATIDRTCYGTGEVDSFSAKQLEKLDGRKDGPLWPSKKDTGIVSLRKVLAKTPEIKHYQFEVKAAPTSVLEQIVKQLSVMFPTKKSAKKVVVTSFDTQMHKLMKIHAPHITLGLVSEMQGCLAQAQELECAYLIIGSKICTPSLVSRAHKQNMQVSVWTVNELATIKKLHAMGVDSIVTDYPSMAIPYVGALQREE